MGNWGRVLLASGTACAKISALACLSLPRAGEIGWRVHSRHLIHHCSLLPSLLSHPSHLSQESKSQPDGHSPPSSLPLLQGRQRPKHLLSAAGPPARLSGRSIGHSCRSTAANEATSLPPSLQGMGKGPAAQTAPGRTSRGMVFSDYHP